MKNGFITLVVLSLLGVLSVMGIYFISFSNQSSIHARHYVGQVRITLLSQSGLEYAIKNMRSQTLLDDIPSESITFGPGTYVDDGDLVSFSVGDLNSHININDGIKAGALETSFDPTFSTYYANALDPWPNDDADAPYRIGNNDQARSALINLRLRRLLNAYGDYHIFVDHLFEDDPRNATTGTVMGGMGDSEPSFYETTPPHFSTHPTHSADGRRGHSMPANQDLSEQFYNNGLGDRIIETRPSHGFKKVEEIKDIVNQWANDPGIELTSEYLQGKTFFEFINSDFTVRSYESLFYRIEDERVFGDFDKSEQLGIGNFSPLYLDSLDIDFNDIWVPHSIPLININGASLATKTAIFYAPTNVSYSYEGATTIPAYAGNNDYFGSFTAKDSMTIRPSIGVGPPIFSQNNEATENGVAGAGRASHLISLSDAINFSYRLATPDEYYYYFIKNNLRKLCSFKELKHALSMHRYTGITQERVKAYEKAETQIKAMQPYDTDGRNFKGNDLYHISEYEDRGMFLQDYTLYTLPNILSCTRRIPSYLGAPAALQSPYMLIKPDYDRTDYLNGGPCQQAFVKCEDFVWRFTHPKICFFPCGYFSLKLNAVIKDQNGNDHLTLKTTTHVKSFETTFLRSQKEFEAVTVLDENDNHYADLPTYPKIKIGPEFSTLMGGKNEPSPYLGFVGLSDFDNDLEDDPFMTYEGGSQPHIVMNFDPETNQEFLINQHRKYHKLYPKNKYQPQNPVNDSWRNFIHRDLTAKLSDSQLEGSDAPQFSETEQMSNISPFNGLNLMGLRHGEFIDHGFTDSLYWRLDDWLDEYPSAPIGEAFSSGLITFWFRMPSGYDLVHNVYSYDSFKLEPQAYARTLVALNLWEAYDPRKNLPQAFERSVTMTVGLRKNETNGLHVFARYDSGGIPPASSIPLEDNSYSKQDLISSMFDPENVFPSPPPEQFDYLGFVFEDDTYDRHRNPTHRSIEARIRFKDHRENGPGSWHRVTAGWNLRWPGDQGLLRPEDQLWLKLHDYTNQDGEVDYSKCSSLAPLYNGDALLSSQGLMQPYDTFLTLSVGESHGRRLFPFENNYVDSETEKYVPFWPLLSSIDNLRIHLGPSDPVLNTVHPYHYSTLSPLYTDDEYNNKNGYGAFRYHTTGGYFNIPNGKSIHDFFKGDHNPQIVFSVAPSWMIKPVIPVGSQLLSVGSRIYYPPDSRSVSSYNASRGNVPYVQLWSYNYVPKHPTDNPDRLEGKYDYKPFEFSYFEQRLFYNTNPLSPHPNPLIEDNFRFELQYTPYSPQLDGYFHLPYGHDFPVPTSDAYWLYYSHYDDDEDHCTNLPWIKELSYRYFPPHEPQILNHEINN